MTIVKIQGGLGNQLFQYALARSIKEKGIDVKLDIFKNRDNFNRSYKLDKFNISLEIANDEEIKKLKGYDGVFRRVLNKFKLDVIKPDSFYKEKLYMSYCDGVFRDNLYLDGYWQNENYFKDIRTILLKEFKIKDLSNKAKKYLDLINNNSVSIHIRRGDYLKLKDIYYICDLDYYNKAIEFILKKIKNPTFFIFSDDINWCKKNLNLKNVVFVESTTDIDDLFLMKSCKHNVIANSTFSWWGAWLNENRDKIVITPKKWFVKDEWRELHLACSDWRKI